jgi:hypothetical protein
MGPEPSRSEPPVPIAGPAGCFPGTASILNSPSPAGREYNLFEVLSVITAKAATSLTGASA